MRRGLKCPNCKGHNAYLSWGFNERIGRRFKQKHCGNCNHNGAKSYYGGTITKVEYDAEMERMHHHITEMIEADKIEL